MIITLIVILYFNEINLGNCACQSGEYYSTYFENCTKCEVDTYKKGSGDESCKACGLGTGTGNKTGASVCHKICPAGEQHDDSARCGGWPGWFSYSCCMECPQNTYKPSHSSKMCIPCHKGFGTHGKIGSEICEEMKYEHEFECEIRRVFSPTLILIYSNKQNSLDNCIYECQTRFNCQSIQYDGYFNTCNMYDGTRYTNPTNYEKSSDENDVYCTVIPPDICPAGSERPNDSYCRECRKETYKADVGNFMCQECPYGLNSTGVTDLSLGICFNLEVKSLKV